MRGPKKRRWRRRWYREEGRERHTLSNIHVISWENIARAFSSRCKKEKGGEGCGAWSARTDDPIGEGRRGRTRVAAIFQKTEERKEGRVSMVFSRVQKIEDEEAKRRRRKRRRKRGKRRYLLIVLLGSSV